MMLNKTSAENEAAALRIQKMKEEGEFRSTLGNRAEMYRVCSELQTTEESFRQGLAVIREVESEGNKFGNYTELAQPFNILRQFTPIPFQDLDVKRSFLGSDQNTIVSGICGELDSLLENEMPSFISAVANMHELEALYQTTVAHVNKKRFQKGEKTIAASASPIALPMQHIPRYVLLLRELLKQAEVPENDIAPDVKEKLRVTLKKVEKAAELLNESRRDAEIRRTRKMFSADKEIQEILIRNDVGKETLLEPKDEEKARKEIASVIRNGEPEDIKKVLNKYQFSIGVGCARPGENSPALIKAIAIKRDFYCGLIDPRIREKIQETKAPIHVKPSFMIWIRAIFHGYTDTTKYIIYEINKAYKEHKDKNNSASFGVLNKYLPMLGFDQSVTALVIPTPTSVVVKGEVAAAFNLLHALRVVPKDNSQLLQSNPNIPKPSGREPPTPSINTGGVEKEMKGSERGKTTPNYF